MLAVLVAVVAALRSTTRSRLELTAEIFALRHQLTVLRQRAPKRLRLGRTDRVVWILLSRVRRGWRATLQIVSPDTVVAWHRRGFSLKGAKTGSRGGLGVLVNDAAEAIATFDAELAIGSERPRAWWIRRGELQGPVRPMSVVVPHELGEDALQMRLVQDQQPVEAF
jgi:hypothetical protein